MIENRTPTITRKEYEELSDRLFMSKLPGGGQDDQDYSEDTLHAAWSSTQCADSNWTYSIWRSAGIYLKEIQEKFYYSGNKKLKVFFDWDPKDLSCKLRTGKFDKTGTHSSQFNSDNTLSIRVTEGWNLHFLALDDKTDSPIAERTYLIKPDENEPHREFQETIALEIYDALEKIYSKKILSEAKIANPMDYYPSGQEPT